MPPNYEALRATPPALAPHQRRWAWVLAAAIVVAAQVAVCELGMLGITPEWSLRWRHQAVERVVQLALQKQRAGMHFLLCGDPVPPGELYAAPGAADLCSLSVECRAPSTTFLVVAASALRALSGESGEAVADDHDADGVGVEGGCDGA